MLREAKNNSGLTVSDISKKINVKKTEVEHWFRTDKSFSIPSPSIWVELKNILSIDNDCFDNQVMEFITREGSFEMSNRFYLVDGISPTITTLSSIKLIYLE